MFAGWVLAIVPAFQHIQRVALVLTVAVVGFGIIFIPLGTNILAGAPSGKGGVRAVVVSVIPAMILFFITVFTLPAAAGFRAAAVVAELLGMAAYLWSWWTYTGNRRQPADELR